MQPMVNSPAEIVRQLLLDLGLGTVSGQWPVYDSNEPDSPDNCITVFDTQGKDDGRSNLDGTLWAHPGFQARIRSRGFAPGWTKAASIRNALATNTIRRTVTVGTAQYWLEVVANIGQVLRIGKDKPETMRDLFTLNAILALEVI